MTNAIKTLVRTLLRLLILWLVDALSLGFTAWILPGMSFQAVDNTPAWIVAVSAALMLAIINLLVRPLILLIARPLGWIVLMGVGFLVNAIALWLTSWLLPGFDVGFLAGVLGGIVIAFFNTILTGILEVDEEGSFYQNRIERLAKRDPFTGSSEPGRGLMMVEIDGLSYWHMRKALADGLMPTLQEMIDEDGYELSHVDCGLPSMTSACQAGILFGDNYDIPAYRWYDKSKQKLYVSADDATELNGRFAKGQGLMRHGSSIMNMFTGDAEKSMFTMANMMEGDEEENKRRAADVNLLMLDPYFLTRALAVFIWELGRELWEAWQQKRRDVYPRLNRMEHFYPFVRAAMCTLMRDISANIAVMDMMRGAPSIYMLYLGYDEVAHHSGPWTDDAFGDLKRVDKTFARLRKVAKEKAPRLYDLIILSDHGQSFGPTFLQRYGLSIKEYIESVMPEGTSVAQSMGGDTGAMGLTGIAGELANASASGSGTAFDKAMAKQGAKLANRGMAEAADKVEETPASVTAYGSGNAAQVYFDLYPRKIKLSELEAEYPGTVAAIVQHEGIGMVMGYEDDDSVLVMGKNGTRNLHTGEVTGEDPLIPYARESGHGAATIEKRVWQLKRVMEFPSAGDLWVISTVYEDGTVAALEELVGSHGGVGGEQTDAFLFHPPDMEVPDTRNSVDVHFILDKHRNAPIVEKPEEEEEAAAADWALSTLGQGISQFGTWLGLAIRCLVLDRDAYTKVVNDPYMTGPALLIAIVMVSVASILRTDGFDLLQIGGSLLVYFLAIIVLVIAGRLLTHTGNYTKTFRGVGFAQSVYAVGLLSIIPLLSSIVNLLVLVLGFLATWMAVARAHNTTGWRTLLLPALVYVVLFVGYIAIGAVIAGAEFTIENITASFGIQ